MRRLRLRKPTPRFSAYGTGQSRHRATFFGSDGGGGKTAAVLRSFIASCNRCSVEPFAWFRDVLSRTPAHSITRLSELLPQNWQPAISSAQAYNPR
jgi:hypothetical protein